MKTMFVEWPDFGVKVEAVLETERNPGIVREIWENLPMETLQEHALVSGPAMYCWVPMLSTEKSTFNVKNRDLEDGSIVYLQRTGNKMSIHYGPTKEPVTTPQIAMIKPEYLEDIKRVGKGIFENTITEKKPMVVRFTKGREE